MSKSYKHYLWVPFASMEFHLFVFDYGKLNRSKVWKDAFGFVNPDNKNMIQVGETYFLSDHSTTTVAVGLMKNKDGAIDNNTIVHECTHAADEYFKILKMSMEDGTTTQEFRANICAALSCKIVQILKHENIEVVYDFFDTIGLKNVLEVRNKKYYNIG